MNGYRKELKYIVSEAFLMDVENRISSVMMRDEHQKGDFYGIRSIYLDTPDYSCRRENEAGISTREKYRIRIYDSSEDIINAEIKIRHRDTISKMTRKISKQTVEALVEGDVYRTLDLLEEQKDSGMGDRVLDKYKLRIGAKEYKPAVIVDYERTAYVYPIANVRITLDRNVFASKEFDRFFEKNLRGIPAIENGLHVLEIKYDEFLPSEIAQLLSGLNLERCGCSKYVRCLKAFET